MRSALRWPDFISMRTSTIRSKTCSTCSPLTTRTRKVSPSGPDPRDALATFSSTLRTLCTPALSSLVQTCWPSRSESLPTKTNGKWLSSPAEFTLQPSFPRRSRCSCPERKTNSRNRPKSPQLKKTLTPLTGSLKSSSQSLALTPRTSKLRTLRRTTTPTSISTSSTPPPISEPGTTRSLSVKGRRPR